MNRYPSSRHSPNKEAKTNGKMVQLFRLGDKGILIDNPLDVFAERDRMAFQNALDAAGDEFNVD